MNLKSHWISETKYYFDGRTTTVWFGAKLNLYLFSDRRTLKFFKIKVIQEIKKIVAWKREYLSFNSEDWKQMWFQQ